MLTVKVGLKHFAGGRFLYAADTKSLAYIIQNLAIQQARVALSGVSAMTDNSGGLTADNFVNPVPLPTASAAAASFAYATATFFGQPTPLSPSQGQIILLGQPADGDTVTVNGKAYTFKTVLTNTDGYVTIAATAALTAVNLYNAINATGGVSGIDYAAATTANTYVTASDISTSPISTTDSLLMQGLPTDRNLLYPTYSTTINLTSIIAGTAGNSYTLAKSSSAVYLSCATMFGGFAADTVTVNGTAFTFVTGAQAGQNVKIGVDLNATLANFVAAQNALTATSTVTASYAMQTTYASAKVFAGGLTATPVPTKVYESGVVTFTANTAGNAGNILTLAKVSGGSIALSGSTLANGVAPVQGLAATGTATFTGNPANNDTLTLNGATAITFVTGAPAANQVQIAGTLAATLNSLVNLINAAPGTYAMSASASATVLTLSANTVGTGGNSLTIAKVSTAITLSGSTLASGVAAVTGVFASGSIEFVDNPNPNDTITLNGTAIAFTGFGTSNAAKVTLGLTGAITALNFATFVNQNSSTFLMNAAVDIGAIGNVVNLYANLIGTAGNSLAVAKSSNDITVSSATLAQGGPVGAASKTAVEAAFNTVLNAFGEIATKIAALQTLVPVLDLLNGVGGTGSGTVAAVTQTVQQADANYVSYAGFASLAQAYLNTGAALIAAVNMLAYATGIPVLNDQSGGSSQGFISAPVLIGPLSTSTGTAGVGVAADTVLDTSASKFFTGMADLVKELTVKVNAIVATNAALAASVVARPAI